MQPRQLQGCLFPSFDILFFDGHKKTRSGFLVRPGFADTLKCLLHLRFIIPRSYVYIIIIQLCLKTTATCSS